MNEIELKEILERHLHWIKKDVNGYENMRADLRGANLIGANLKEADLIRADLRGANLRGANLTEADLIGANLAEADLAEADLRGANLIGANLIGANLIGAEFDKKEICKVFPICCPDHGSFTAWKKANGYIVKLIIPNDAKRGSAFGRKCRADKAICVSIESIDGNPSDKTEIASNFDESFIYRVGETIKVDNFDDNRMNECAPGIHFFITRQEAVEY